MEEMIEFAKRNGVSHLTAWGLSYSNVTNRTAKELTFLYGLFTESFRKMIKRHGAEGTNVKIKFIGEWGDIFPDDLKRLMSSIEKDTDGNADFYLTFMLAYSGKREMVRAAERLRVSGEEISEVTLKKNLMTADLPPVDLVIRTGGDPHWSDGFMMWDVADAQFYFTDVLWPDFSVEEFEKVIDKHMSTERRFGK
jgi:undecaprenyl diphosphate synthase